MRPTRIRRRRLLAGAVGAGALLAGCTGTGGDAEADEDEDDDTETEADVDPGLRLNGTVLNSSFPIQLFDPESGEEVSNVHWHSTEYSHWHFVPLEVPHADVRSVEVVFNNRDLEKIPLGPDQTYQLSVYRTEDTPSELLEIEIDGSIIDLHGASRGEGELLFQIRHGDEDETAWTSPPLLVAVE
jgi:hypothetical protein